MKIKVHSAALSALSYLPDDNFSLKISFAPSPDLANADNVSVDLFRIEPVRNQFAFGFGTAPIVEGLTLPDNAPGPPRHYRDHDERGAQPPQNRAVFWRRPPLGRADWLRLAL